jgi:phosphoserine phosphatase
MFLRAAIALTASLASGFSRSFNCRHSGYSVRRLSPLLMSIGESGMETPDIPPVSSTSKRLFLVRHGEVINPGGEKAVFYGSMDVPLSKLGELEAQAAGEYLSRFALCKVFSSPLSRAIYGAKEVRSRQHNAANMDVVVLEGFKELDRGDWCGLTKEEIGPDRMARFDACDLLVTPANGESFPALKQRVLEAHHEALAQMQPGSEACIVSHLQVTRCLLSEALGIPTSEMTKLKVATASITCIDYDDDEQVVRFQSFKPEVGLQSSVDKAN